MEAELSKKKFPGLEQPPKQSAILRKRLQGQVKYFDSGDYNMAKSKQKKDVVIGKAIPTVDQLPQRKQSCSRLSSLVDGDPVVLLDGKSEEETGNQLSQRKQLCSRLSSLADGDPVALVDGKSEEETEEQKAELQVVA